MHSNASTAISGHQMLPCSVLGSLRLGGMKLSIRLRSITAVHLALNSHVAKCHLEVTISCSVTSDCQDIFGIVNKPQTRQDLGPMVFPNLVLPVFSPWNVP